MPFVRFRDCTCPESPHSGSPSPEWGDLDGDVVELRPRLSFEAAALALRKFTELVSEVTVQFATAGREVSDEQIETELAGRVQERVGTVYLEHAVVGWNLPERFSTGALLALPFDELYLISEAANDLYTSEVVRPLVKRIETSSRNGSTAKSRRPPRKSSPRRRTQSGQSS